jgi:hypothetical protein
MWALPLTQIKYAFICKYYKGKFSL